jgi:hypothetical protein
VALDDALVVMVQLAVVKMIDVIVVANGGVTAARAVLVYVGGHAVTFLLDVISAPGQGSPIRGHLPSRAARRP